MKKVENIFNKTSIIFTIIFTLIAFFASVLTLSFPKDGRFNIINLFVVLIFAAAIFAVVFFAFKAIDKIDEKKLKFVMAALFAVFILGEIVSLVFLSAIPNTDSYRCLDTAAGFANDSNMIVDENHIYYNYFAAYSNNNLFVMIYALYFSFVKFLGVLDFLFAAKILNSLLIFLSALLSYLCVKQIFNKRLALKVLFLFIINPVFYLYVQWIYTTSFSLPITMAVLYLCLLIKKTSSNIKRIIFSALLALVIAFGYLIRPTSIFPLFAFLIIALFKIKLKKDFLMKTSVCAVSFVLVFITSFSSLSSYANKKFEKTLDSNFPLTHWVMMGLKDWGIFNKEDRRLTTHFGETKEEKQAGNLKVIKQRIADKHIIGFAPHFTKKIITTFSDGKYGIESRLRKQKNCTFLYNYVNGDKKAILTFYCQGLMALSYAFMFVALILALLKKKQSMKLMPIILTVLGGFVFYLIWEAKQAYSMQFIPFFIILAAYGVGFVTEKVNLFEKKFVLNSLICLFSVSLCVTVGISVCMFKSQTRTIEKDDYLFTIKDTEQIKLINSKSVSQEFYADKEFNYLKLYFANHKKYEDLKKKNSYINISIVTDDLKVIAQKQINLKKLKQIDNFLVYTVNFKIVSPKRYQKFIIKLTGVDKDFPWTVLRSYGLNNYKGELLVDGKPVYNDLNMRVGLKHTSEKISKKDYIVLCSLAFLFQAFLIASLVLIRKKKLNNKLN